MWESHPYPSRFQVLHAVNLARMSRSNYPCYFEENVLMDEKTWFVLERIELCVKRGVDCFSGEQTFCNYPLSTLKRLFLVFEFSFGFSIVSYSFPGWIFDHWGPIFEALASKPWIFAASLKRRLNYCSIHLVWRRSAQKTRVANFAAPAKQVLAFSMRPWRF